jgi:hypothetical protein
MTKAIIDRDYEVVRFFGLDKYDGMTTTFCENGISNTMDDEEIKEALEERTERELEVIFE